MSRILVSALFCQSQAEPLIPFSTLSYDFLNTPALQAKPLPYDPSNRTNMTWSQSSTCCGYGMFTAEAVSTASGKYGLFDVPCQWPAMPVVAEWGYEFHNNQQGIFPLCGNFTMAHYPVPPANRTEALRRLALYWACRAADARATVNASVSAPIFSMPGHYFYSGLGAAFEAGKVIPGHPTSCTHLTIFRFGNRGEHKLYQCSPEFYSWRRTSVGNAFHH